MPQMNWYDPEKHHRYPAVGDYKQIDPTDPLAAYDAWEQRKRERAVKLAHFRYIKDKLEKCYLHNGVHNVKQQCRHLIMEFEQTKNELMGWKEGKSLPIPFTNRKSHLDLPPGQRFDTDVTE